MDGSTNYSSRIDEVQRIFEEFGLGNAEILESWDGEDIDDLAEHLSEEEFQTLLDELGDLEEY